MATHPSSPAPGPAEFSLTPQGEFAGKSPVRVVKPIVLVGSDEHCHLHLISSTVSRHHALFVRDGDRLYVFDLGSRTKILVNGKEQREAELASGDVVRIGKFSFKFTSSRPVTGAGRRPGPVRLMVDGQAVPAPPENRLVLIGRTAGSDVMLVEESVSARHAVIFEVGGKRYVRDLDSRTGTFLNGKKIHQQEFKLGDELRIGETVLKLAELVESLAEHADVSPVDIDEPLLLEPEPIPVADEAELPPVAPVEEAIPLDLEPIESEPAEQPREPAVPIAEHSASEPLPLELEPEPASQPEAEPAAEPAAPAIDHFDDLLELLPEASKEAAEPAPLDLEPEPSSQPEPAAAQPAAVADHFDEVLESLPEIHPKELDEVVAPPPPEIEPVHEAAPFELEPEPPTQREAAPVVEAVPIAADYFDEVLESLPETHPKELDDVVAPPPEINEVHDAAPLEIEPELPTLREAAPVTEPVPVVADHFDEVLESLPETHPKETDEVVAPPAPEIEPVNEAAPLELEPEPVSATVVDQEIVPPALDSSSEYIDETHLDLQPPPAAAEPAEQAAPDDQTVVASEITEPEPTIEASPALDLSDAPEPLPETEAVEPPAIHTTSELDLLAELASKPLEEFKPVEFEMEPESVEPVAASPQAIDLEPEPIREPELTEETSVESTATINLSDAPSLVELEPEPEPEAATLEPTIVPSETIDLSDAPVSLDLEPEPISEQAEQPAIKSVEPTVAINLSDAPSLVELETEPASEPIEQAAVSSVSTIDLSDTPTILELEPGGTSSLDSVADSSKTVDLDIESTSPATEAEQTPINFEPAPIAEETPTVPPQKATRGRKRPAPAEPKPPKVRKTRSKRVPPRIADEEAPATVEAPVPEELEAPAVESPVIETPVIEPPAVIEPPVIESPVVEPPTIEVPDLVAEHVVDEPADSAVNVTEPISTEVTLTASDDVVVTDQVDVAPEAEPVPVEPPLVEPPLVEPAMVEPPPAEPAPLPAEPFMSVGNFAHLTGGTVNLDHSLGGMPIKLQELPPAPTGFGQVKVNLTGKASSPFSSFAKSEPLVFDEPDAIAPLQSQALAEPELIAPPPEPEPPAPVEAQLETVVTPPPEPSTTPTISPESQPPQPLPVANTAPPVSQKPQVFAKDRREIPAKLPRPLRAKAPSGFGPATTAFDGLAPAFREADAFSNIEPVPLNDAAFGGARLGRSDEHNVPETPETAARLASGSEHDFAEDEFWNRTDEDDGLTPVAIPPVAPATIPPVTPARVSSAPPPPAIPIPPATPIQSAPIARDQEDRHVMVPAAPETPVKAKRRPEPDPLIVPETPADPIEQIAPIPAEPIEPDALVSDSGEASEPADNSMMESIAASSRPAAPSKQSAAPPPPRKRRRFRIPFLMPILLLAIGLSLGAIWRFIPLPSQIVGKITFENYNWTPGTRDGTEFEASQRRLLEGDPSRRNAVEYLRRDHPDVSAGFLASPDLMGRVVSSVSLNSTRDASPAQTVLQVSYSGANKDEDRLRMMALLQSVVDSNAPLLDSNRRLRNAQQQAQQVVDDTQQKLDQIKTQLANLQTIIDAQPPVDQMAKLTAQKSQLEKARDDAEEAVNRDHSEIARLEASSNDAVASATTAPADAPDPQLRQMRQQLADLAAELDSAHSDQLASAVLARQQLEKAAKQFNDQLSTADEVLGSSSQLRQFVDSARDSQSKARELINILIVDGEDLEKQLEDTRRDVEDLIEARREQKWQDDPQLQELRESLDSAQHRYNANVGDGNKDPRVIDPLQKEIDKWLLLIKARQQQLGVDPSEVKVEEGLNNLVQSLRNKLQNEKQLVGQVLDPLEKQLNALDPVVAGMPEAEKDLAHQLHQRLSALNDARQKYAETVGEGEVAPSAKVTELQKQIAELKDRTARREQDFAQKKVQTRDAEHMQDIAKAKETLDADLKTLDAARSDYNQTLLAFEEKQAQHQAAEAAGQKKINLLDAQKTAYTELEAAQRDRDEKLADADHAFDIKPITDADVIAAAPADPRMMYSLFVLGAGVVLLAGLTFVSHAAAHRAHQLGASGHHEPPNIAEQIDSLVLPMASDPQGSH